MFRQEGLEWSARFVSWPLGELVVVGGLGIWDCDVWIIYRDPQIWYSDSNISTSLKTAPSASTFLDFLVARPRCVPIMDLISSSTFVCGRLDHVFKPRANNTGFTSLGSPSAPKLRNLCLSTSLRNASFTGYHAGDYLTITTTIRNSA